MRLIQVETPPDALKQHPGMPETYTVVDVTKKRGEQLFQKAHKIISKRDYLLSGYNDSLNDITIDPEQPAESLAQRLKVQANLLTGHMQRSDDPELFKLRQYFQKQNILDENARVRILQVR